MILKQINLFALVLYCFFTVVSYAQESRIDKDTLQLEEVTVSASKTGLKNQLKVPMSVKAIGAKKVKDLQIQNVNELGRISPNFQTYDDGGGLFPIFSSRGVFTIEQNPVMGIYIDDVPVFDTFTINNELSNIENIEVIKGGQGMLYGRSSIAGVIKITTKQSTNKTALKAKLGLGNLAQKTGDIHFQKPIVADKLFLGANLYYNKRDGYVKNDYTNVDLLNMDVLSGGINLRFLANDLLKMTLRSSLRKSQMYAYALIGGRSKKQDFFEDQKKNNSYKLSYNTEGNYKRIASNNSFNVEYNATNFDVNAITTLQYANLDKVGEDFDWSTADVSSTDNYYTNNNFSQELRFNSKSDSKVQWLAGVFIHYLYNNNKTTLNNGKAGAARYTGTDAAQFPYSRVTDAKVSQLGFAGFTNFEYALTDAFKLSVGIRYEQEYFNMDVQKYHTKNGTRFTHNGAALKLNNDNYDTKVNFRAFSYKAGFSYDIGKDKLLWASVSRGYRPGGVNSFGEKDSEVFQPEFSFTTELGFKGKFFNNRVRGDITAFYTDYTDQQVFNVTNPRTFAAAKMNLGNSRSYGLEFDGTFLLNRNFTFDASVGYLDTKITNFEVTAGFPAKKIDYKGKRQPYSPRGNAAAGLRYQAYFSDDIHLSSYIDYQYQTTIYFDYGNEISQEAYGLLNAMLDLSYKNYTLSLWAKNLTNKVYFSYGYGMLGVYNFMSYGLPRTFGATISATF